MSKIDLIGNELRAMPNFPLAGHFTDYLTSLEPSGEHIEYWPMSFFKHQQIDLDRFKQECEVIDES